MRCILKQFEIDISNKRRIKLQTRISHSLYQNVLIELERYYTLSATRTGITPSKIDAIKNFDYGYEACILTMNRKFTVAWDGNLVW